MELLAGLLAFGPLVLLMVLLIVRTRRLWPKRPAAWWEAPPGTGGRGGRGDAAGDREPRRPLLPSGAAGVALPEPHERRQAS